MEQHLRYRSTTVSFAETTKDKTEFTEERNSIVNTRYQRCSLTTSHNQSMQFNIFISSFRTALGGNLRIRSKSVSVVQSTRDQTESTEDGRQVKIVNTRLVTVLIKYSYHCRYVFDCQVSFKTRIWSNLMANCRNLKTVSGLSSKTGLNGVNCMTTDKRLLTDHDNC